MLGGFAHHPVHIVLVQVGRSSNGYLLLLAGSCILSGHAENTIRVDVKGYLNLRNAARRRRDTVQAEAPKRHVIRG